MARTPIGGLEIFLSIVQQGSLRGAARALGVGAPAVTHQLKSLEAQLGVNLFVRTTRSVELTEAGAALAKRADPALSEIRAAVEEARGLGQARTGTLRITLPWSAYRIAIEPILAAFRSSHPGVQLELSFNEALVDVVREGFHAGIRLGDRLTPGMIAVPITPPLQAAYSAAPSYFERQGRPRHPRDLIDHRCIRYRFISSNRLADWQFREGDRTFIVDPGASLVFDSFQAVVQAACAGHGIGWSLRAVVEQELRVNRLETVLEDYCTEHPPFFLYYPEQNRRLELLRVFIESVRRSGTGPADSL